MVLFLFPISPNTIKTIRWGWKLFFFSVLAIALKELERYNVQFQDRGNHKDPFLILTNASISFRSCSRTCSYVVSKVFPLCSLALMKAFASFDCRPLKRMSFSENSFKGVGVVAFFAVVAFFVGADGFVVGLAASFNRTVDIFTLDETVN